jgi:hypothetical protein
MSSCMLPVLIIWLRALVSTIEIFLCQINALAEG